MLSINEQNEMDILNSNIKQTYKQFRTLMIDYPELQEAYNDVRYGITQKFNIIYIINSELGKHVIKKGDKIYVERQTYEIDEFYKEIEERESKMKKLIIEYTVQQEEELTEMR